MGRWPLRFRFETVHVDRARFDTALYEAAVSAGVRFVRDRVADIDVDQDRVVRCWTQLGKPLTARWFIDGSGRARLFARAFGIGRIEFGPTRVAIWGQCEAPQRLDGTMLYLDDGPADLRWAWEIPLTPQRQSVGVVISHAEFQERRHSRIASDAILRDILAGFPGITRWGAEELHAAHVRSVRCYTHRRVAGGNWFMVGEAAAFVDPLTSTGVSAAMRHGVEAAEIIRSGRQPRAKRALQRFDRRVRSMSNLYNNAIEALLYAPGVRRNVGIRWAARAYVILGFGMSALYARIGGIGAARHAGVLGIAGCYRLWMHGWLWLVGGRETDRASLWGK
jgi:flavin-dependent dehydrogenase